MNLDSKVLTMIDLFNERLERIESWLQMPPAHVSPIIAPPSAMSYSIDNYDEASNSPAKAYSDDAEGVDLVLQDIAEDSQMEDDDEFVPVNDDAEEATLEFRTHFDRTRDGNYQDPTEDRLSLGESLINELDDDDVWGLYSS